MTNDMIKAALKIFIAWITSFGNASDLAFTPPMGWNSWNHFGCNISESIIISTIDSIISLELKSHGYMYINIDDCWQATRRNSYGRLESDPIRFPRGIKHLSDYAHDKGLKLGLYSSSGFKTCQGYPASLGLESVDADTFASWEIDYLKYDNCYTELGNPYERFKIMSDALNQTSRAMVYSICEWGRENPAVWAPNISNSWRVSEDIKDNWSSITSRVDIVAPLWRYAKPGSWNDPDMLEVGNGGCTLDEYKYHFSMWAFLKAPMILGNDLRKVVHGDAIHKIITNKKLISINKDPIGQQARRIWSDLSGFQKQLKISKIIATKCNLHDDTNLDAPQDQQFIYDNDTKTIRSLSSGMCLTEHIPIINTPSRRKNNDVTIENLFRDLPLDLNSALKTYLSYDPLLSLYGVYLSDCKDATKWYINQHLGGSIVSQLSSRCLEVNSLDLVASLQGKHIQTGVCNPWTNIAHDVEHDFSGHQSWSWPQGNLLNLYQRQCLTWDRDASPGVAIEAWKVHLEHNEYGILIVNKGDEPTLVQLTALDLYFEESKTYTIEDLWTDRIWHNVSWSTFTPSIKPHGALALRVK